MAEAIKAVGLFAGVGGIELGFERALGSSVETTLLCESWEPARAVLAQRFEGVEVRPDVRELSELPGDTDALFAGFPCTDLSQAGHTAGIHGEQSGLVAHVFEMLRRAARRGRSPPWLVIENVSNMLALEGGVAMRYLVDEIESLGYRWAYRVVDSRSAGVPQRRRRVLLLASPTEDPRPVLFADDAGQYPAEAFSDDAFGFYWTEGLRGLGWARDAIPTLKGGSTVGIPSAPAIWAPACANESKIVLPSIEDAEELQGFPRGWTSVAADGRSRNGPRWKLVGNAVTVGVASWLARRLLNPGTFDLPSASWEETGAWPAAAWGERGRVRTVAVSEFPVHTTYRHLVDVVDTANARPLSHRGAAGFWRRLQQGNLGRHPGFRRAVAEHVDLTRPDGLALF